MGDFDPSDRGLTKTTASWFAPGGRRARQRPPTRGHVKTPADQKWLMVAPP